MSIPRPEHPRPDCVRSDWLNLNGKWDFCYDPRDRGRELGYHTDAAPFDTSIIVPFAWQSELSGLHNVDYHGVVWYRRDFMIPASWRGQRVFVRFGAVDYYADIWINGLHAGTHEGGYSSFEIEITSYLVDDRNSLTVRVDDPANLYQIPHGKQASLPPDPWQQFSFTPSSGIWQTVWLEARPKTFIDSVHCTPNVAEEAVYVTVRIAGNPASGRLVADVHSPSGEGFTVMKDFDATSTGLNPVNIRIPLLHPQLWDIHSPNLYTLQLSLETESGSRDSVQSYFGMRMIEQRAGQVWLNGRPIYLMTALDQGYWRDGIYTAPTDEALKADVLYAKSIGLNGLRKHLKVEDPRFLYWADQLGILLWCDMPCPTLFDETGCNRLRAELLAMIARDYNHPSIIVWCPYNETWGLEFSLQHDKAMQAWVAQLYDEIKAIDTTRLVVENSGWSHVKTDLADFHYYTGNPRDWRLKMQSYAASPNETGVFAFKLMADGYEYDGAPLVVSEFGYGWQHDSSWGLRWSTNELRRHPNIVGYTYCELYDVEYEYCGYALYDRTPKRFGYDLKDINSADYIILDYQGSHILLPGDEVTIPLLFSAYDYPALEHGHLYWKLVRVLPPEIPEVALASGDFPIDTQPWAVIPIGNITFATPQARGATQLVVWVENGQGMQRARNALDFEIYNPNQSFFDFAETPEAYFFTLSAAPGNKAKSFWNEGDHTLGYFVDDRPGAAWFEGADKMTLRLPVVSRMGFPPNIGEIRLVMELGSRPREITQSVEGRELFSDLTVSLNGIELQTIHLHDLHVHAGGALTRIHNTGVGEHGEWVEIGVPNALLESVVSEARKRGYLEIGLEVKQNAEHKGGLTVFGARTGRYGIDPSVRITLPKQPQ
jgi:hypothetical protein